MDLLSQFILGILTSLIGGYLLAIIPLGKIDKILPYKRFQSLGIIGLFFNQDKAIPSILKDCKKTKFVYLLAMKGSTFSSPDNQLRLHQILKKTDIEQKYLISSLTNPYLTRRAEELDLNMLSALSLRQSHENFENEQRNNTKICVRFHDEVVRFRLIFLENYLYLSFQEKNKPGRLSPVLKIDKNSQIYKTFFSFFFDLWEKYGSGS